MRLTCGARHDSSSVGYRCNGACPATAWELGYSVVAWNWSFKGARSGGGIKVPAKGNAGGEMKPEERGTVLTAMSAKGGGGGPHLEFELNAR